ncbi:DNA gyrase inhibitor YacG [Novosphingobium umbonatum]|jgi:endogenous inhibitor of DNA gyrase (YacG/DUF329 family)|uniref:DNA gyrase inhibitor YacG n=1 Tax=Novosphingobium umbonatum TaxID=1908524 RepID=A0A437N9B3_9SPHN|nr:DNA gyrase inhibitor YacG [Novosphingobium umbonatum]RVU06422.1 DNA gyrase inhibitor YacG [Novosphingobium umbonatum]
MTNSNFRKCPICGKPRSESHSPFCSSRCRDRDLMQWLSEGYALPAEPVNPAVDEENFHD